MCSKSITVTILIMLLLCLMCSIPLAQTQKRSPRKRARTTQVRIQRPQPSQPAPTNEKSDMQRILEQEVPKLSALSSEDKAVIRTAIETLNRQLRIYQLRGFDDALLVKLQFEKMQEKIDSAIDALPDGPSKFLLTQAAGGLLDAWDADNAYLHHLDDRLLKLIDKYNLNGEPATLIGTYIIERKAMIAMNLLIIITERAGIMPASQ
jgi:hypothetical protein